MYTGTYALIIRKNNTDKTEKNAGSMKEKLTNPTNDFRKKL
jgi:hypothetical protein